MFVCYLCRTPLNEMNKSEEHIIPNAIGGKLKSTNILCDECNNKLGKEIDESFNKIFSPFTKRIDMVRDRPDESKKINGRLILSENEKIEVSYKNFKVTPKKAFHKIDEDKNELWITGLVPGGKGGLLRITKLT